MHHETHEALKINTGEAGEHAVDPDGIGDLERLDLYLAAGWVDVHVGALKDELDFRSTSQLEYHLDSLKLKQYFWSGTQHLKRKEREHDPGNGALRLLVNVLPIDEN